MKDQTDVRDHLLELLEGRFAHIDVPSALRDFPVEEINTRVANSPHTAWQLLEHMRIAQWDIVEFSRDADHVSPDFPDGYWTAGDGTPDQWRSSLDQVLRGLQTMRDLVSDPAQDLFTRFSWGDGQTLFREAMLVADHNSYHLGQIMLLKKMLS